MVNSAEGEDTKSFSSLHHSTRSLERLVLFYFFKLAHGQTEQLDEKGLGTRGHQEPDGHSGSAPEKWSGAEMRETSRRTTISVLLLRSGPVAGGARWRPRTWELIGEEEEERKTSFALVTDLENTNHLIKDLVIGPDTFLFSL